jgi:hypothetical protein
LSREAPATNVPDQMKRAGGACFLRTLMSRQRFWGLVGSNFELGSELPL